MKNTNCIKKFKAKIAYQSFYNSWQKTGIAKRDILTPYILNDKRFIIIYFLSFFGFDVFNRVLKFLGKSV